MEEMGGNMNDLLGSMLAEEAHQAARDCGRSQSRSSRKKKRPNLSTTNRSSARPFAAPKKTASSSSTRWTRSPGRRPPAADPDVSREGVQRDILPIVEGSTVLTKYGPVKTDHVLFIGAGAFHVSKPSDLIPELQGRFPIRVELEASPKMIS